MIFRTKYCLKRIQFQIVRFVSIDDLCPSPNTLLVTVC